MIVIHLKLQRGDMIYWNFLFKSKERFFLNIRGQRKLFDKKIVFRVEKNGFRLFFLVLIEMLLKTQFFEKEFFFQWKTFSGLLILFFGVIKIKNLSKQFITAHIVSRLFLCNIELHFFITCENDGIFSKKRYLLDNFDLSSLVLQSMATSRNNSIGPKTIQTFIVQVTRSFL